LSPILPRLFVHFSKSESPLIPSYWKRSKGGSNKPAIYPATIHFKNAPTKLSEELGYGDEYNISDYDNNFAQQEHTEIEPAFYIPGNNS
jgi:replication-associated recombination protein RarA